MKKPVGKPVNCNVKPHPRQQEAWRESPGPHSQETNLCYWLCQERAQVTLGRSLLLAGLSFFTCAMKTI